jgi:putative endonuclease
MNKHNQVIGKWGEDVAAEYLQKRGAVILARNVRTPYGEIDIIASQNNITIFVEVKTRTSNKMGLPETSINARKLEHMLNAAQYYCAEHQIDHWQLDVISIEGKEGGTPRITHFENVQ